MTNTPLSSAQELMLSFALQRPRCALWADPGIGKTRTVLELIARLRLLHGTVHVLIVSTKRVARDVWPAEMLKWFPDQRVLFLPEHAPDNDCHTHSINWEQLHKLPTDADYDVVVVDEARRLKSYRIRQGGVHARRLKERSGAARWFIELTGTPAPNGEQDLWGQMYFLDGGNALGASYTAFVQRWFRQHPSGYGIVPCTGAAKDIGSRIAHLALSIRAGDHLDITAPIETVIPVQLPDDARKVYRAMEKEFIVSLGDKDVYAATAGTKSAKLEQIASGGLYDNVDEDAPRTWHDLHDAKIEALRDLSAEYGAPMLVIYRFIFDLIKLRQAFDKSLLTLDEPDALARWDSGDYPLLAIQPASAGHGLNLHHPCRAVVIYSINWDLELRMQAIERVGPTRQAQLGRTDPVLVYSLVAENTVDTRIYERHKTKASTQDLLRSYVEEIRERTTAH